MTGVGDDPSQRRQAALASIGSGHQHECGRAVGNLRRVTSGDRTVLCEGGPQLAQALCGRVGPDTLVGAGTVTTPAEVEAVVAAGGRIIVMPHADVAVIRAAKAAGAACTPGICTPV